MPTIPTTPYTITLSGMRFPLTAPKAAHIRAEDIAMALGSVMRFSGQRVSPMSVAAHSMLTADLLDADAVRDEPLLRLAALLHDASEAYLGDVPKPLKDLLPDYQDIEAGVMAAVAEAFGLPGDIFAHPAIEAADRKALWHERGAEEGMARATSVARMAEGDPSAGTLLARTSEPSEWGFDRWPNAEEIRAPHASLAADRGAGVSDAMRMRFILALEAEARRLETKRPAVAIRLSAMLKDAADRGVGYFMPCSPIRTMAMLTVIAPIPAALVEPAEHVSEALAFLIANPDMPQGLRRRAAANIAAVLGGAATELLGAFDPAMRPQGLTCEFDRMDPALRREDPARALDEAADAVVAERREAMTQDARATAPGSRSKH